MIIKEHVFYVNGLEYTIRSATPNDAMRLSQLRVTIDGETENLDRESGEAFIDVEGFKQIIKSDSEKSRNLFLVVEVSDLVVGFSRCEGNQLKRSGHIVGFGVCVLKKFWGYGMGKNLLKVSIDWADSNGIKKITLNVVETNEIAIKLYSKFGFEIEGTLKNDKFLSDGKYYNTIIMGRWNGHNS